MIANTVSGNDGSVGQGSAFGSSGSLAVSTEGVAGSFQVAAGGSDGSVILGGFFHVGSVDGVAINVDGESDSVAFISRLGSGPGGVGDGVVDNGSAVAVVGVDNGVTVDSQQGSDALTQVLGSVGSGIVADLDVGGVHADVAVAEVINGLGVDDVADDFAGAVVFADGFNDGAGQRGISDIEGALSNAGQLVSVSSFLEQDVFDLGHALEIVFVGSEGDNAVFIGDILVGAGAQRSGGLFANDAQVTLGEAEHVVLVVVQSDIAVVVHRSNGQAQLIDSGGVDLGGGNGHAVVTGLNDTGNVGSAFTGGDTGLEGGSFFAQSSVDQLFEGRTGGFVVDAGFSGQVVAVGINDQSEAVSSGSIGSNVEAPHAHGFANGGSAVGFAVGQDFFNESFTGSVNSSPEGVVLFFGVELVGFVASAGGVPNQVESGFHAGTILFHTNDGSSVQGGGTVIGGVAEDVHGEDDVVDVHGIAIGEDDVFTHGEVVVDSAVSVFDDFAVSDAVIGVLGAVVGTDFAFDTIQNQVAFTVGAQQAQRHEGSNVLVISGGSEEGGELLREHGITDDEDVIFFLGGFGGLFSSGLLSGSVSSGFFCGLVFSGGFYFGLFGSGGLGLAASSQREDHNQSKQQSKQLLHLGISFPD